MSPVLSRDSLCFIYFDAIICQWLKKSSSQFNFFSSCGNEIKTCGLVQQVIMSILRCSGNLSCSRTTHIRWIEIRLKAVLHYTEFSARTGICWYYACVVEIQTKSRLIKVQQLSGKKVALLFTKDRGTLFNIFVSTFTAKYYILVISSNQNLFSCKQISNLKPGVH